MSRKRARDVSIPDVEYFARLEVGWKLPSYETLKRIVAAEQEGSNGPNSKQAVLSRHFMKAWLDDRFNLKTADGYVIPAGITVRPRYRLLLFEAAIEAVLSGEMNQTQAGKTFAVPRSTLSKLVRRRSGRLPPPRIGQRHTAQECVEAFEQYVHENRLATDPKMRMATLSKILRKFRDDWYHENRRQDPPPVSRRTVRRFLKEKFHWVIPQVSCSHRARLIAERKIATQEQKARKEEWKRIPEKSAVNMEQRWRQREGVVGEECLHCGRKRHVMDQRMYGQCRHCKHIICREHLNAKAETAHSVVCKSTCHCRLPCLGDESCRCSKSQSASVQDNE